MKYIYILALIFTTSVFGQIFDKPYLRNEKENYIRMMKAARFQYPGDSDIDVTYYKLNLTISYSPKYLTGIVQINAKSTVDNLTKVSIDLQNRLTVSSVTLKGKDLTFSQDAAHLIVTLPASYNKGDDFSIVIEYAGVPGSSGFGSFEFGSHNGSPSIYTLSEPFGASDWWPCKDNPSDKADSSDMIVTVNQDLYAVSNGLLVNETDNGDGTKTFYWHNSYPIANYLISLAISNYTIYTNYFVYGNNDSMPVIHYIYPEDFQKYKYYLDMTPRMIKIFSDRYGLYPFIREKYGHAEFGWGGGMEHQTVSSMGAFGEGIVAHELSHQWFGDMITCATWQNIWLNEGFATYSEGVYYEAQYGEGRYNSYISSEMQLARMAIGPIFVADSNSVSQIFDPYRSYAKGGIVLHMLRGIVGDSTFFKILRTYAADPRFAYGAATTEDFQSVAEQVYGSSLDYFFKEWIYGRDYPQYIYSYYYNENSTGKYDVHISLTQKNNSDPSYFTMPVQFKINFSDGDTTFTIFNNKLKQTFDFTVDKQPSTVILDPNNYILKSVTISDVNDSGQPRSFELNQNYPNPFNPSTIISYRVPKRSLVRINVYDVLGKKVASLVNEEQDIGKYNVEFNPKNLSSGIYFYTLTAGDFKATKKMILLR